MNEVADRIRLIRKSLGLTQQELGKAAGVTKSAVSQWERGSTAPERNALLALQRCYGISPDWVITGQGPMRPELSDALAAGQAGMTGRVRGDAWRAQAPADLQTLMETLSDDLERASPEVREAIGRLLLSYAKEPGQGPRIAAAIQALLGKDADPAV